MHQKPPYQQYHAYSYWRSISPTPQWHPQVPLREGLTDQAQSVVAPAQKLSETHESEACGGHLVAASSATPYGKLTVWENLGQID